MTDRTSTKAILYHYYEVDRTYRDNLIYFLASGYSADIDIYLILSSDCSVEMPPYENLKILKAPNLNNDYGGYCHAIARYGEVFDGYDSLAFVNSSVRGPFLPGYVTETWHDIFTRYLVGETHLVGTTYNSLPLDNDSSRSYAGILGRPGPFPHIQSTAYVMSGTAFSELRRTGFYDHFTPMPKSDVIARYEIGISAFIRDRGWKSKSILSDKAIDRPDGGDRYHNFSSQGDPQYRDSYFGRTFGPEEAIFVKTNRKMLSEGALASHTFTNLAQILKGSEDVWPEAADLLERSYLTARNSYDSAIGRRASVRGRILGKLQRLLDH